MRLTVKLVVWFFVCVVVAVGLNGLLTIRGELSRYEAELTAQHVVMGRVMRVAFAELMTTDGEARAVSVLETTDKGFHGVDFRWVLLTPDAPAERKPAVALAELAPLNADHEVHARKDGNLLTYVPVHIFGRDVSALELSESLVGENDVVDHAIRRAFRDVAAVGLVVGLAAGLLGILLVARPMRRLVEHARRIGRGDLSTTAAKPPGDEIAELAMEMNAMCEKLAEAQGAKLRALDDLRRAERLSTVGKLASGLAHELGTPLNVVTLRAKSIAQGRTAGGAAEEAARSIAEQAARMTNLVRQLLDFARRKPPTRDLVDLAHVAKRTAELVDAVARKSNVRIEVAGEPARVRGDAAQLEQVLTNLYVNAIHSMPQGGTIEVTTGIAEAKPPADHGGEEGPFARLAVKDHGSGIPADVLPRIFEPFFTTKDVGDGTGLGLAVCDGIVRDHGGFIDVRTAVGEGSVLVVHLPALLAVEGS